MAIGDSGEGDDAVELAALVEPDMPLVLADDRTELVRVAGRSVWSAGDEGTLPVIDCASRAVEVGSRADDERDLPV